jgi:prolyl-tRNA editing enzyme YbaK/EbsC (Cys-tRNA(Pro) deacylase)
VTTPREPVTQAVRAAAVAFEGHPYSYVEDGGRAQVACDLGVAQRLVVKTLIYTNGGKRGYIVSLAAQDALRLLAPTLVRVAV